jgi:predicted nucleotidyltransferase
LRHREAFRNAADYVAAAFARLTFVERVVLFGSVAEPPRREMPRQRRYRRAGARLWHESKDVDLAVWVSEVSDLKALQRARGRALNELLVDLEMGVAHHQVDVFLFEPRTDRYLGRLCHFGVCPKDKPECRVAGCGAALFLRQHDGFVFDFRSLEHRSVVLFDRAKRLPPPDEDDIPF